MGLTLSQRRAVTKAIATRYTCADKAGKGVILDELWATTGWHRNHVRRALSQALRPRIVRPRKPREPRYGAEVIAALAFCWAVLGAPTGRRLADDRAKMQLRGRSHTKPGSLLTSQIPSRTWADWDDAGPGFGEIDVVGQEGGNALGEYCSTLTVTDMATGWTESRADAGGLADDRVAMGRRARPLRRFNSGARVIRSGRPHPGQVADAGPVVRHTVDNWHRNRDQT